MPEDDFREDESQSSIIKPKATKRKSLKSSPEKPPAKRLKQDVQAKQKIVKAYKPANVKEKFKVEANSDIVVAAKRKTRSTDKSDDQEFQKPKSLPPKSKRKLTESKTLSKKEDAPVVKKYQQNKKTSPIVLKEQPKRVTRSQSIKHWTFGRKPAHDKKIQNQQVNQIFRRRRRKKESERERELEGY